MGQISGCRADFFEPASSSAAQDATWLFCACSGRLEQVIGNDYFQPMLWSTVGMLAYLVLVGCCLCAACRGAARARKRRKQHEFELMSLEAAEREATTGTNSAAYD